MSEEWWCDIDSRIAEVVDRESRESRDSTCESCDARVRGLASSSVGAMAAGYRDSCRGVDGDGG